MYDYGARMYMPDLGRWGVHDPLSEVQFAYSPYSYVYGNPIRFNDPTGMIGEEDPPKKGSTPDNPIDIGEIKLTKNVSDSKLSFMGIQSLSAYHGSQDRLAFGIRNSKAALATEKFERNLAFTMGTFLMGGSNLAASAGWATLDAYMSYQDEKTQNAVGTIQLMALIVQLKHGNINAAANVLDDAVKQGDNITQALSALSVGDALRIENAATRINKPIIVVGSRASGTAGAYSDWDYIIEGGLNSRDWSKIKNSLPGAKSTIDNTPRNIDIFTGSVNRSKPHIIINPRSK
ncbi:RHS repeat-associated core domain-containing protein [Chryseobacterium sp. MYb7]|uniref:RHS repeat-associated core domain-containing protein n=1 Tax=Chryseobacterium sp. MYb7 TaxID=1827290 RepID=UPI001E41C019|nr:RHS repeat-associated core domain-containing protein [Chryseobacterium sp. MYb7]